MSPLSAALDLDSSSSHLKLGSSWRSTKTLPNRHIIHSMRIYCFFQEVRSYTKKHIFFSRQGKCNSNKTSGNQTESVSSLCQSAEQLDYPFPLYHKWLQLIIYHAPPFTSGIEIGPSFGKWTKRICRKLSFKLELCYQQNSEKNLKTPQIFGQILIVTQVLAHKINIFVENY